METKPVILVVDDTEINTYILAELLGDRYGAKVAFDGKSAIEIARKRR